MYGRPKRLYTQVLAQVWFTKRRKTSNAVGMPILILTQKELRQLLVFLKYIWELSLSYPNKNKLNERQKNEQPTERKANESAALHGGLLPCMDYIGMCGPKG